MPYKSVNELPTQVKKALGGSIERMKAFLAAYNSARSAKKTEQESFRIAYSAASKVSASEPMPNIMFSAGTLSLADVEMGDEDNRTIEIPVAPANATYKHPWFGKIEFNSKVLGQFMQNFRDNVLGVDIALDISHKPDAGAIGWFTDLVDKGAQGLWAVVEMTDEGMDLVRQRKFKYISPEFATRWKNPRTGEAHDNVLFGAAVTNRPFLKDMDALLVFDDQVVPLESLDLSDEGGEQNMDPKIYELLGLSADADDAVVLSTIEALVTASQSSQEEDDKHKQFAEMFPDQAKQLADMQTRLQEATVNELLTDWTSRAHSLPPVVLDDVRDFRILLTGESAERFDALMAKLTETGTVPLSLKGSTNASEDAEGAEEDPTLEFAEIVEGHVTAGMSYAEAMTKAAKENPELARKYSEDAPVFETITTGGE